MFNNKQLVDFCLQVYRNAWVYWYGTCGFKCSQSMYNAKSKQYPSHYTASRKSGYMADIAANKMCADCVGMIKAFFWMGGNVNGTNKYASNGCPDVSADGMISLCKETGPIKTIPDIPGLVVWKSGHIGVYIGSGYTIEMRGFAYDCVKRKVSEGPWTKWGKLPSSMLEYLGADDVPETISHPTLRNGSEGNEVKKLQLNLIELGYDLGRWGADGDFGDCTELAVKKFQKDNSLVADGIVGEKTWAALEKAMENKDKPVETPKYVQITGGSCYVRTLPNVTGDPIGVAMSGMKYPFAGAIDEETKWLKIKFNDTEGWVSNKYGRLVE